MKKNYWFYLVPIIFIVGILMSITSSSRRTKSEVVKSEEVITYSTTFAVPPKQEEADDYDVSDKVVATEEFEQIEITDFEKEVIIAETHQKTILTPNEVVNEVLIAARNNNHKNFLSHFCLVAYSKKMAGNIYDSLSDNKKEVLNEVSKKKILSIIDKFIIDKPIEHASVNIIGSEAEIILNIAYADDITVRRLLKLNKIDNQWKISQFPQAGLKINKLR